ncbi:signal peptidase I [Paenarthrobacter nicotinovorans]|uniref:signal peptidase I n=1 Tax=Paenarthrobacter nicotinovorans TaxID=29320 RepID=UPI00047D9DC6|nr:signal peptidase I [Paenarthrobacter nicotinovorans]
MSTLTSINGPALHGRRSAVKSTLAGVENQPAAVAVVPCAPEAAPVKQAAADAPTLTPAAVQQAAAAAPNTRTAGTFRRVAGKTARGIGAGMLVLAALVFLFLAIGPRVLGYQTSTMLTGSMAPMINPGDIVVTVPTPITDIKVGDVITYHIPVEDHRVETHRITEITPTADGGTAVQTKGDANNGIDPWIATLQGTTVDKHVATIPGVGNAIRTLRQPIVMNILMYGAPSILVIGMLASIWTKNPTKTTPEGAAEPKAASSE